MGQGRSSGSSAPASASALAGSCGEEGGRGRRSMGRGTQSVGLQVTCCARQVPLHDAESLATITQQAPGLRATTALRL